MNEGVLLLMLICAYIALVPTLSLILSLEPYNEKRVLQVGVLFTAAASVLRVRSVRHRWLEAFGDLPSAARWGLGGVLGLGLLSSALASAPFYAFLEVGHFLLLFGMAGVVVSEVRCAPGWVQWGLLGTVVMSAALYAVYFGVGYASHLAIADVKPWPDGGTNYVNIRIFNHYQTWTLPLLTGIVVALPKTWRTARGGGIRIGGVVVGARVCVQRPGHHRRDGRSGRRCRASVSTRGETVASRPSSRAALGCILVLPSFFDGRWAAGGRKVFRGRDVFRTSPIVDDELGVGLGASLAWGGPDALCLAAFPFRNWCSFPQRSSTVAGRVGISVDRRHDGARGVGRLALDEAGSPRGETGVGRSQRDSGGIGGLGVGGSEPRHGQWPARDAHQPSLSRIGRRVGVGPLPIPARANDCPFKHVPCGAVCAAGRVDGSGGEQSQRSDDRRRAAGRPVRSSGSESVLSSVLGTGVPSRSGSRGDRPSAPGSVGHRALLRRPELSDRRFLGRSLRQPVQLW